MQERWRSWSVVWAWTSYRIKASFCALSVALVWAATASSATAASTWCTWNAVGSNAWWRTLITDVHGARELHALDGRPQREVQVGSDKLVVVASFCYLGDMWWLWTFNHNTSKNHLEEVQGPATSSLYLPPLFQDTRPHVQLLCAEHNAPCHRDLATDKAKPPASAAKWQGNDQTNLQCQATRHCHHQVQWATCMAWRWGAGPHSEGEKALLIWTYGTLQFSFPANSSYSLHQIKLKLDL